MKKDIYIFALHLGFGGIEKAVTNLANVFCEDFKVHLMVTYHLPDTPAYTLDERVEVKYLTDVVPNRKAFLAQFAKKNPFGILKEGLMSLKILRLKKQCVIKELKQIQEGIIMTTRNEDSILLSKFGNEKVHKIAQLHQDYTTHKNLASDFATKYDHIDDFVVLTKQLEAEIKEIMMNNTHTNVITIPNFLEALPEDVHYEDKEKYMVSVGRFHEVKGFTRLLEMYAAIHEKLDDWKLVLIGEGEEEEKLKKYAAELGLHDKVIFTGKLTSPEIENWNRKSSIFLMSSFSEGLPFVLIEAFSCMVPAVAFDVRVGPRAVIDDGIDGFLVPDGNKELFIEKVVQLATDSNMRMQMSKSAYEKSNQFSREFVKKIWYNVLLEGDSQ